MTTTRDKLELVKEALEDSNNLLRTITDDGVEQSLAQIHDNLNIIELLSEAQEGEPVTPFHAYMDALLKCGNAEVVRAAHVLMDWYQGVEPKEGRSIGWITEDDLADLRKHGVSTIYDKEQENAFGPKWRQYRLYFAPPSSDQVWNEAIGAAEKLFDGALGGARQSGDWWAGFKSARQQYKSAIRSLKRPSQAQEPRKEPCPECNSNYPLHDLDCKTGRERSASGAVGESQTPRTDAAHAEMMRTASASPVVELCRQLERELDNALSHQPAQVTDEQEAFEAWSKREGWLNLWPSIEMTCEDGKFPATYYYAPTEAAWRAWANGRGALSRVQAAPEGWKLVPIIPTKEMLAAGNGAHSGIKEPHYEQMPRYWTNMVSAAPSVQNEQEKS